MFSEKIKSIRAKRGWTQKQLAEKIGRPENTIVQYEIERRAPTYGVLKDLVEKAKVEPSELF
jgi:transcriptional regulator with XRE-family HTH domain